MTCREWVLSTLDMSPRVQICNEFKWFLSLRCLAPPNSSKGYWEKIGNRKSEQRQETELMQTIKYEHVFPLLKTCDFSPLEHEASRVSTLSPWAFSPLIKMIKLWCDLSLPLWHQFPRSVLLDFCHEGLGPWVIEQSWKLTVMLVEDKNHWVELEQTEIRNKWQVGFPVMESVTLSCVLRLHRKDSVGPTTTNRWDRVQRRENTCHLSSLDK